MKVNEIKALLVDDDPQFLKTMKESLENKNCLVQCVSNQQDALSTLVNEAFHVVFIDCILNSGQGVELVQDIKKMLGDSVEIIMMSGILTGKSLSNYIDLGISDFISKPISDKDIEENIKKVREKYVHESKKNLLAKLFTENNSDIQILKSLISLKQVKDYEFFFYLNSALLSKELFTINFKVNDKRHKIICKKGVITDYECDNTEIFLNKILSKNFITPQESEQLKGSSQSDCVQTLLNKCMLSSGQISDIKYNMFIETLKEIVPGVEISLEINMGNLKKESFALLDQSEYADLIFLVLKEKFSNQFSFLFDEKIMKKSLVFEKNLPNYLPEVESFLSDLKEGIKLQGIYNKYLNDKDTFCFYLLYILLKGNVYLSKNNTNLRHHYLYERYESLYKFINKIDKPKKLFLYLRALPMTDTLSAEENKETYLHFVKHNHPDTIPFDIPKDLTDLITKVLSKIKTFYDICSNPTLRIKEEKKKKKEKIEKEMILTEKKKICERHLEEEKYEKAFSLIRSMPRKTIDEEISWQLFYLWIHFKDKNNVNIDKKTVYKYTKNVQSQARELQKEKLYNYVMGLSYESKQNYKQAELFYKRTKMSDPTFQPCYPAIKRCSLKLLAEKKKNQLFIDKLRSFSLNDLKKNLKKSG